MSETKIDFDYLVDKEAGKFEKRSVTIVEVLNNIGDQVNMMFMSRFAHPVSLTAYCLFGMLIDLKPFCNTVKQNCAKVREFILSYVTRRKLGESASSLKNVDMLSLFLESPDIFTDDFIVDELMDFFFAGTITT